MRSFSSISAGIVFMSFLIVHHGIAQTNDDQSPEMVEAMAAYEKDNMEEAIQLFTKAAKKGNVQGMIMLGREFFSGRLERDEALDWAEKAAAKGEPNAMVLAGAIHAFSFFEDVASRKKEASRWLKKAAKKENFERVDQEYVRLACSCYSADAVDDELDALIWCKSSAEAGNLQAMLTIAIAYQETGDFESAISWLEQAMEKDSKFKAMLILAELYEDEASGAYRDEEKALALYHQAAEKGSVTALFQIGLNLYRNGEYRAAMDWFDKTRQRNSPFGDKAAFYKAECHFMLKQYGEARSLYRSIYGFHEPGEELRVLCAGRLAEIYRDGLGVEPDWQLHYEYFIESRPEGFDN